jgi:hypothetical protein
MKNKMIIRLFQTQKDNRLFRIEGVYPEGSYLYIFDLSNLVDDIPENTHDYLQNDNLKCMEFAERKFQVPLDSWQELPATTLSCTESDRPASRDELINAGNL